MRADRKFLQQTIDRRRTLMISSNKVWRLDLLSSNERLRAMLDHMRWIAALIVVMSHARSLSFIPRHEIENRSILLELFYFFSRFGKEAVVIFFVLSGLLIAGKFINPANRGTDRSIPYALDRLTRLLVVLIPAVIVSLLAFPYISATFIDRSQCKMGLFSVIGNIFFAQDILVPPMCTNEPLWSLSNEFWYYMIFPLLIYIWEGTIRVVTIASILVLVLIFTIAVWDELDDRSILLYFPVWLSGLLVWRVNRLVNLSLPMSIFLLLLVLFFARSPLFESLFWFKDYMIAGGLVFVVWSISNSHEGKIIRYVRLNRFGSFMAGFSYSLYLIHYPTILVVNTAIESMFEVHYPLDPRWWGSYAVYVFLIFSSFVTAYTLYFMTERHTKKIRNIIRNMELGR